MKTNDRFERRLPTILESLAPTHAPGYLDDILGQVGRMRQRPGWTFPERWLPVSVLSNRLALAPRIPMRSAIALILIILALIVGAALLAGARQRVPAPFGPAGNGLIAFVDSAGSIQAADPTGARSSVIVPGPGVARPVFSPDGRRLAYLRTGPSGNDEIVVADADGSDPLVLTPDGLMIVGHLGWTPDGSSVVVSVPPGTLYRFDVKNAGSPTLFAENVQLDGGFDAFNASLGDLFRPPSGNEILYLGTGAEGLGLYRRTVPGGSPVAVLTAERSGLPIASLRGAQWSPDGSQILVTVGPRSDQIGGRLYVMRADGSGLRRLTKAESPSETRLLEEGHGAWAPDGTRIAFMRFINGVDDEPRDAFPIIVADVQNGTEREVGTAAVNGYEGWSWAPDGASIVQVSAAPSEDAGRVVIVDVVTGRVTRTDLAAGSAPSWQRTAP